MDYAAPSSRGLDSILELTCAVYIARLDFLAQKTQSYTRSFSLCLFACLSLSLVRARPRSISLGRAEKHWSGETSRVTRFSGKFHSSTLPLGLHAMALSRSTADLVQTRRLCYTATL